VCLNSSLNISLPITNISSTPNDVILNIIGNVAKVAKNVPVVKLKMIVIAINIVLKKLSVCFIIYILITKETRKILKGARSAKHNGALYSKYF